MAAGLCTGAKLAQSSIFLITSSSITAESLKYSPPWTILCPTAPISDKSAIAGYSLFNNCSIEKSNASVCVFTGCCKTYFSPPILCVKKDDYPILS